MKSQQIVLASRPVGTPKPQNFRLEEVDLPQAEEGEVTVRVLFLSLDPYMRGRMSDAKSYAAPVPIDGIMEGETICEVLKSRSSNFAPGDIVRGRTGWRTHAVVDGNALRRVETHGAPLTTAVGALGMPGFTAWSGLKFIGQPKAGETVAVAAASGPVGSMVGQLAKLLGARAIGIAGGTEKCAYVKDELHFDAVIDHRSDDLASRLEAATPDGIDVYFENVGGHVWDAVLPRLNKFGRVPVCGLVAHYNGASTSDNDRLPATMSAILRQSLLVRGFIQTEFAADHFDEFLAEVGPRVAAGELRYREDIVDGIDNAPDAFTAMLTGGNFGKLIIKVA
ncbi:NADPH-dependent curcumin reductase CurA [Rhizobium sp. BIGb0125]|jgi:NADPH-dependent curcumin reductase CurA|uniref:NADP-dependent oxidoreductase n=1 Tax=Rhizobium sp. BIGb0125 TaxID=2940618 RepID=UPI00216A4682|nr:NADP-dependent oxidoreductase [Rhizobium sp. BIGb0125]MCS4244261.1 NADPH-dependent curcumin reductase CurA [Rhizobium sp. BIGb0125]